MTVGADIRQYLEKEFADIAKNHGLERWPSPGTVTTVVDNTGNLFIYASTIVKQVSDARSPAKCLEKIIKHKPHETRSQSPYKALDLLYKQILDNALEPDPDAPDPDDDGEMFTAEIFCQLAPLLSLPCWYGRN